MGETVSANQLVTPAELRQRIQAFENILLEHEQIEIPVTQYFCNGTYVREITIPATAFVTGRIHKHACLSIVLTGEMEVVTDQGPKRINAPMVFESPAGVKRAGRAITDCRWLTIHPYDGPEQNEAAMADLLCVDTFEQLEQFQSDQHDLFLEAQL